ncbi:hypothetical protein FH972_005052 [Carpinus fangiana]|uniref:Histidinol-phosphatase n=1 Tax=Carpinus fangiana TaxID=176857 RepID=A0A5N6QRJ5_9ROSI|nr:hypothetical protein FH972_005052 [Carpinus fangiana]
MYYENVDRPKFLPAFLLGKLQKSKGKPIRQLLWVHCWNSPFVYFSSTRKAHLGLVWSLQVANTVADAAGEVIRKYFRKKFDIVDKEDLSPVTIADQSAEESMVSIILENFPSHAIYGEENGWRCKEKFADYVWVLDPIDGTKSFITGKPLFGTLIALLYRGKPILGIINQPILRERWIGISGRRTTLNGQELSTRSCAKLSQAYLYTTSPHLFSGDAVDAFARVRNKVCIYLLKIDFEKEDACGIKNISQ